MKTDPFVRIFAGVMVLGSVALARFVHPAWLWLTVFVGFNLIQSAFTGFCPPEMIARRFGWVRPGGSPACGVVKSDASARR